VRDTTGPTRLTSVEVADLLFGQSDSDATTSSLRLVENRGLSSRFVRNDTDRTLSLIVEATDGNAIFWQSPTSSQVCNLQVNRLFDARGTLTNVESLTDAKVINQEDFSFEIIDVLSRSMTQVPLGTTSQTIYGFPYANDNLLGPLESVNNNVFGTPFLYLTPFNNIVSLRVDYSDGTSR
jgi:hypothetical protein